MNVVIVGFGAIGCRHAQALMSAEGFQKICIVEPSEQIFNQGISKIGADPSRFIRVRAVDDLVCRDVQIAVVATSSEPRFRIMKHLIESGIRYFLVEKIVFQSMAQFDDIIKLLEHHGAKAYCNFVNRYFNNYVELKNRIKASSSRVSMTVIGGDLGLGCNAIHYMDLFEYLTGNPIALCDSALTPCPAENRRGSIYKEFSGVIFAEDEQNNMLSICFDPSHTGSVNLELHINGDRSLLSEGCGTEYYFGGQTAEKKAFHIIPTSRLTHRILNDIMFGSTLLPTVMTTKNTHSHLFKQITQALGLSQTRNVMCPIT